MSEGPKLLLIDGSNLCFREFFSKKNLKHKGRSVDVIFGLFKSLASYHKKWPDHFRIIAWEGGYERRLSESEAAVESGIIPSSYKQNRRDKAAENDPELEPLFDQMGMVKDMLKKTRTLQVSAPGYEGDDVLYSYARWAERHGGEAIIVSSDKDFYQCISPSVKVFDARSNEMWDSRRFQTEMGYGPELWVDKGAIEGEIGPSKDNIFGVTGWGAVTATKYVSEFGGIHSILDHLKSKEKRGKKEDTYIEEFDRLILARSLKQMDDIPNLPMPRVLSFFDEKEIRSMFAHWGFLSLVKEAPRFL